MIKLEKMSYKQPELDLIAEWRNQSIISLRSNDLTAKGESQRKWIESFTDKEKYYFIYDNSKKHPLVDHNLKPIPKSYWLIGYCGLDKIDPVNKTAEMGLLINPAQHKKGYGSAVVKELLRMAFEDFNLNCIFIEVILSGTGNISFWEKQGFVTEGQLRARHFKNGQYYDSKIGSVTRESLFFFNKDK